MIRVNTVSSKWLVYLKLKRVIQLRQEVDPVIVLPPTYMYRYKQVKYVHCSTYILTRKIASHLYIQADEYETTCTIYYEWTSFSLVPACLQFLVARCDNVYYSEFGSEHFSFHSHLCCQ